MPTSYTQVQNCLGSGQAGNVSLVKLQTIYDRWYSNTWNNMDIGLLFFFILGTQNMEYYMENIEILWKILTENSTRKSV